MFSEAAATLDDEDKRSAAAAPSNAVTPRRPSLTSKSAEDDAILELAAQSPPVAPGYHGQHRSTEAAAASKKGLDQTPQRNKGKGKSGARAKPVAPKVKQGASKKDNTTVTRPKAHILEM